MDKEAWLVTVHVSLDVFLSLVGASVFHVQR